ncbi:hypothetical protein MKW98_032409 [Papaver atlanticum]|uniref:PPM-type phosphatase domain-containing protein n=1 Tax=Papaver atlanticum TaxID=357466 RepID=A0AAD4XLF5_9MAGN|nr:hypothetical protein MKW98_032409 [Papaver atlanticum]
MGICVFVNLLTSIKGRRSLLLLSGQNKQQGTIRDNTSELEDKFHKFPGRRTVNGTTDLASLWSKKGTKGTNQDAMIVWENFASRPGTIFCGVFDGHGRYGHIVSKRVRDCLPLNNFSQYWGVVEDDRISQLKGSFLKAFEVMDRELRTIHPELIDCFDSGTAAVAMIKQGQHLVIGNIGDSRAVLGTRDQNDSLIAVQLTKDLKPNLPGEAKRIRGRRGRVFALKGEVARVWLPNKDAPGLAMSRAFGDFCLNKYGVISVPDVYYRPLTDKDEFLVLATDGIWDVLSNKEVVNIVRSAPAEASEAQALVEAAVRAWKIKYPTSKVDDCTAVVCHLRDSCTSSASSRTSPPASACISNIQDRGR